MTYDFVSYSRRFPTKAGSASRYSWCVFLHATRSELEAVRSIEYTLHPTFPDPVRKVSDPKTCFALISDGWGGFEIRIRVITSASEIVRVHFPLSLKDDAWPKGHPPVQFSSSEEEAVYNALKSDDWEWRKPQTIAKSLGISLEQTQTHLKCLQDVKAVRKAPYKSLEGSELWAPTEVVGLLPEPIAD